MIDPYSVFLIGSSNFFPLGSLDPEMKEGDVMWQSVIDPIFGYIALIVVAGAMIAILYLLVIVTFLVRHLIAPEYEVPKVSFKTHKYILIGIGVIFLIGFVLFASTLAPAILAVIVLYLFFKRLLPLIWKKLLA